jgi:hypothetical protein
LPQEHKKEKIMKRSVVVLALRVAFFLFMTSVFSIANFALGEDHPGREKIEIHTSTVEGYGLVYALYHFPERKTWHLMVTITGPEGSKVEKGKVGFLVVGPDGSKQKAMAMGMKGSYGADVDIGEKGVYTVKTKAIIGDRKLFDRFKYEVR